MLDIMIDLETADKERTAAILALGAVHCDLITGRVGESFYEVISLDSSQEIGCSISEGTFDWWLSQSKFARESITEPKKAKIKSTCLRFNRFLNSLGNPGTFRLWSNGPTFDSAILRHTYDKLKMDFPIPFWQDRCCRTSVGYYPRSLFLDWKRNNVRSGTAHNALSDAKYQIKFITYIHKELGVTELY